MKFNQLVDALVIAASAFSVIYAAGVVWRVEKKLDISYKYLLSAIIAFTLWQIIEFAGWAIGGWAMAIPVLKLFFAILFLKGILTMRRLCRIMDGELPKENNR